MKWTKRGLNKLLIVATICLVLFFSLFTTLVSSDDATQELCYTHGQTVSCKKAPFNIVSVKECTDKLKGLSMADPVNTPVCDEGCCCFFPPGKPEKPEFLQGKVSSYGYCNYLHDNVKVEEALTPLTEADGWFKDIKKADACSQKCQKIAKDLVLQGAPACSNAKDDDNDKKIDLDDAGCKDAQDNDEKDPASCKANTPLGEDQECLCGTGESITTCTENQFCQAGTCVTTLAGKVCIDGAEYVLSKNKIDGCPFVVTCENGQLDTTKAMLKCSQDPEICDIKGDDDVKNGQDCQDPLCYGAICYDQDIQSDEQCKKDNGKNCYDKKENSACIINNQDYGAEVEGTANVYACCENGLPPIDCGKFGKQCGSCSCENAAFPKAPQLTLSHNQPGIKNIVIKVQSMCPVTIDINICRINKNLPLQEGQKDNCHDPEGKLADFDAVSYAYDKYNQKGEILHNYDVIEKSTYYVQIKAHYPNDKFVYSDIKQITTGDNPCLVLPVEKNKQFCNINMFNQNELSFEASGILDPSEQAIFDPSKQQIYQCNENNELQITACSGENEICVQNQNGAKCVKQSPCIFCGIPFNMFADKEKSILQLDKKSKDLCKNEPLCYYDYTDTAKDSFNECQFVNSCYDYRSKDACQSKTAFQATGTTNKCLGRECIWKSTNEKLNLGICEEKDENYRLCEFCNSAEHNNIFDACNRDRCIAFSSSKNKCFIESDLDQCKAEPYIGCSDYKTKADCTAKDGAEKTLAIDLTVDADGNKQGTNKIITPSNDFLGLGVCKWIEEPDTESRCIKDANNDNFADENDRDNVTPVTTLLTPTTTAIFNLTFAATDPQPKGKFASYQLKTYYCYQNINEVKPCYPDKLYTLPETLPFDHGKWKLRYFSEDTANNLEQIQDKIITIDREKPKIILTEISKGLKTSTDIYSGYVMLEISFENEDLAFCTDTFEGKKNGALYNTLISKKKVVTFENLKDGYYAYAVTCTDKLGNTGEALTVVKIENDERIQNLLPNGVLDYGPVALSIWATPKYGKPVGCKFSEDPNKDSFIEISGSEHEFNEPEEIQLLGGKDKVYQYTKSYTPDENASTVSLSIVCKFSNGDEAQDEIQFVYDIKPPTTSIVDVAGKLFDTNKFYKGDEVVEKIFFKCNDNPKYGFGCDKTYWCIKDQKCDPSPEADGVEYDEMNPFDPKLSDPGSAPWVCYYSTEQTIVDPITEQEMGGKTEPTQCIVIKTDTEDPELYTKYKTADGSLVFEPFEEENIKLKYTTVEEGALLWPLSYIELLIAVDDPDAVDADDAQNTVDVTVTNLQEQENNTISNTILEYKNLNVKDPVELQVELGEGLNQIEIKATDRSGAIVIKKYYVIASDLPDDILEITKPYHGVSDILPFTFEIKIKEEYGLAAEQCGIYDDFNILKLALEKKSGGKVFQGEIVSLTEGVPETWNVKCIFGDGKFTQKSFTIVYDKTKPQITALEIIPHNNKIPPTIMDLPIEAALKVTTDDKTRCKLSRVQNELYSSMKPFESYTTDIETIYDLSEQNQQILSQAKETPEFKIEDKKTYTYYVKCDNGLLDDIHITEEKNITFVVDTSLATDMKLISPPLYTSKKTIEIILETSKSAVECTLGPTEAEVTLTKFTSTNNNKNHKSGIITFEKDGQYKYWVQCSFPGNNVQKRDIDFIIDTTPPVFISIDDGNVTDKLTQLSATWKFEDNASQIESYEFSIGTAPSQTNVYNWTNTTSSTITVEKLKLLNATVYYWNVRALNKAGLWSGISSSNGITVNTNKKSNIIGKDPGEDLCFNSFQDQGETSIDCGGDCPACLNEQSCSTDIDCASGKCVNNVCVAATCTDNILNQDESDIDCGGSSCSECTLGKQCNMHADCTSNYCKLGICTEATCADGVYNGNEEGKDCGGNCPACAYEEAEQPEDEGEIDLSDKKPEEKSSWLLIVMIIVFLLLAVGGGYYYYTETYLPQQRKSSGTTSEPIYKPLQRQIEQKIKPLFAKRPLTKEELTQREASKQKRREELLHAFDEEKAEEKLPEEEKKAEDKTEKVQESKKGKKQEIKKQKPVEEKVQPHAKETAFEKLKQFTKESSKQGQKQDKDVKDVSSKSSKTDVFEKLKQIKKDKK